VLELIMAFTVREFIPEKSADDLKVLLPAYLMIWNAPENLEFLSFTGRPFEEIQVRAWFSDHLARGGRYFGAVSSNCEVHGILITRSNPIDGFEALSVAVSPSTKRRGIGERLLQRAVELAITEGYRAIEGQVFAHNIAMLRLLLKLSFIPIRMNHNRGVNGEDVVVLRRTLRQDKER
jgi:ribosomal protein S18 acetylase RimI-like enzyme